MEHNLGLGRDEGEWEGEDPFLFSLPPLPPLPPLPSLPPSLEPDHDPFFRSPSTSSSPSPRSPDPAPSPFALADFPSDPSASYHFEWEEVRERAKMEEEKEYQEEEKPIVVGEEGRSEARTAGEGERKGKPSSCASEKRRRDNLKEGFLELRRRVPSCSSQSSKAVILRKGSFLLPLHPSLSLLDLLLSIAAEYIDYLVRQKVGSATLEESKELKKKLKFTTEYISCISKQKTKLAEDLEKYKQENNRLREALGAGQQRF